MSVCVLWIGELCPVWVVDFGENNYSHGRSRKIATPTLEHGWKDTFVSPRDFKYCLGVMTDLGRVSSTLEYVCAAGAAKDLLNYQPLPDHIFHHIGYVCSPRGSFV